MKKVGLLYREKFIEEFKSLIEQKEVCFFVSFERIPAFAMNQLRNKLTVNEAKMFVTKNSLFKKALSDINKEAQEELFQGSTAAVFTEEKNIVNVCKLIVDFSSDFENFVVRGGYLYDTFLPQDRIISIAKLPPREVLIAQTVSGIAAPLTGFMATMQNIILKFVWAVEKIKEKKSEK